MHTSWLTAICFFLSVTISGLALPARAQTASTADMPAPRMSAFSKKPVPRFEMLEDPVAYGRRGPGKEFPIAWVYQRQNLPLLVVKETKDWWRVRDPDGSEVWMHQGLFTDANRVMVRTGSALMKKPDDESIVVAHLQAGVLAQVVESREGWLKLKASQYAGWVKTSDVWGHLPKEISATSP